MVYHVEVPVKMEVPQNHPNYWFRYVNINGKINGLGLWTPWLLTLTWLLPWRASLSYPMAMTAVVRTLGTCLDPHNFYCHSSIEASILGQLSIDFVHAPPPYMQFWDVLGLHHGSSWRSCKKRWAHCTRFPDSQCLFDEAMFRNSGRCLPYFSNLI